MTLFLYVVFMFYSGVCLYFQFWPFLYITVIFCCHDHYEFTDMWQDVKLILPPLAIPKLLLTLSFLSFFSLTFLL